MVTIFKMAVRIGMVVVNIGMAIKEIIANNITEIMTAVMVVAVIIEIMTAGTMATGITIMAVVAEKVLEASGTTRITTEVIITSIETEEAIRGRLHTITNQIITEIIFIDEVVDDKNSQPNCPYFIEMPKI